MVKLLIKLVSYVTQTVWPVMESHNLIALLVLLVYFYQQIINVWTLQIVVMDTILI